MAQHAQGLGIHPRPARRDPAQNRAPPKARPKHAAVACRRDLEARRRHPLAHRDPPAHGDQDQDARASRAPARRRSDAHHPASGPRHVLERARCRSRRRRRSTSRPEESGSAPPQAVSSRQGPAPRAGPRSWANRQGSDGLELAGFVTAARPELQSALVPTRPRRPRGDFRSSQRDTLVVDVSGDSKLPPAQLLERFRRAHHG